MSKKKSKTAKLPGSVRRKPSPLKLLKSGNDEQDATESIAEGLERRTVVDRVREDSMRVDLNSLLPLQGKLKSLSEENFERLRDLMLRQGFRFPVFVWADREDPRILRHRILDGHQRVSTLKRMRDEGYKVPSKIAVHVIEATDEIEARDLLLSLVSQFGDIEAQGLYEFVTEGQLDAKSVARDFRIPDLDGDAFLEEFFSEGPDVEDFASAKAKHQLTRSVTCPHCEKEFDLSSAEIKKT